MMIFGADNFPLRMGFVRRQQFVFTVILPDHIHLFGEPAGLVNAVLIGLQHRHGNRAAWDQARASDRGSATNTFVPRSSLGWMSRISFPAL